MDNHVYKWGDLVRVISIASKEYHPGELGEICGIWPIVTEENSVDRGEPLGMTIYTVEFESGVTVEIPEYYLEQVAVNCDDSSIRC